MKDSKDSFKKKWNSLSNLKNKNQHLYKQANNIQGDCLRQMFSRQCQIQGVIQENHNIPTLHPDYIKSHALSLIMETAEVLDRLPFTFKYWKDYTNIEKRDMAADLDVAEEVIDIFHFLMNLWMSLGYDFNDFYTMYMLKSQVNLDRQKEIRDARRRKDKVDEQE